ncbi:MAG TPA: YtxH domain-containing protein [Hymenobacter sp.]|jgi:gas vesicle protein
MKDNTGKIILSLLAGATAGAVAGLLLAPETGEGTRASLKRSATKLSDDLGKAFKQGLSRFGGAQSDETAESEGVPETQADAEEANNTLEALASAPKPRKAKSPGKKAVSTATASPATDYAPVTVPRDEDIPPTFDDFDSDYDGTGSEGRHKGNPSFGQTL